MSEIPKAISIHEIDGFMVTNVTKKETGLSCKIFLECIAKERFPDVQPYVFAAVEDWLYPISISESPIVLDDIGLEDIDFMDVYQWIMNNRELLIKHWNCQFDDYDIYEALWEKHRKEVCICCQKIPEKS